MTSKQSIPKLPAGVKLSDVFHLAADKYLAATDEDCEKDKEKYSCLAIDEALYEIFGGDYIEAAVFQEKCINLGLYAMGLDTGSITQYTSLGCALGCISPKAQAARYTWLKFCAVLAEEQEATGASWN